jgi:serine/threonine protein kinase
MRLAEIIEMASQGLPDAQVSAFQAADDCEGKASEELPRLLEVVKLLRLLRVSESFEEEAAEELPTVTPAEVSSLDLLDDFRILREIGRGGMGIVYEAEQISLGRRVALKVLPFPAILNSTQLRRFQNEARATAALDHPHIVRIYAVGCAGTVHYFAMQLIDGQSLADFIRRLRMIAELPGVGSWNLGRVRQQANPAEQAEQTVSHGSTPAAYFRMVARLGLQAALALQHAHDSGVVHRDIKPSNLLVADDGHLWVTDFGLARTPDDSGLTASGDLVGTLRYMAPEQLTSHALSVDHRADIYSLGGTLYELLTLRPAFSAADRPRLIRQITEQDPPPPRSINRSIPHDLQTIVRKAMSENPGERYGTARQLADDLQRYLDCLPIVARPPTSVDRIVKIAQRHAMAVCAALLTLTLVVLVLATSVAMVMHQRDAAQMSAERANRMAEAARQNEIRMRASHERAESNFRRARQAVNRMSRVATSELSGLPGSDAIRHTLLEDALQYYESFVKQDPNDDSVRLDLAAAFDRVGAIHHDLGNDAESENAFVRSQELLDDLVARYPADRTYRRRLADVLQERAHTCLERMSCCPTASRLGNAAAFSLRRLELLEELAADADHEDHDKQELARAHTEYANALAQMGQPQEAEQHYRGALALWSTLATQSANGISTANEGRADTHFAYATLLLASHRFAEAHEQLAEASLHLARLPREPGPQHAHCLALVKQGQAELAARTGAPEAAARHLTEAVELCAELRRDFPDAVHYAFRLASCQYDAYRVKTILGQQTAASESLRQSTDTLEQLVGCGSDALKYYSPLARNYYVLGLRAWQNNETTEADRWFRQSRRILETCHSQFPVVSMVDAQLAWFLTMCPSNAFRDPGRALEIANQGVQREPENAQHWIALAAAQFRIGNAAESLEALRRAETLRPTSPPYGQFLKVLALTELGRAEAAQAVLHQAPGDSHGIAWEADRLAPLVDEARQAMRHTDL